MAALSWELLHQVFTAETLMASPIETWEIGGGRELNSVRDEFKEKHYDLIPVSENNRIVGVLRTYTDNVEPEILTTDWLVSRDTPISHLLAIFTDSSHPGLFVIHGQDLVGLVTPADLNKLPARVYFYNLIGELELALLGWVQNYFAQDAMKIISALSEKRQKEIIELQAQLAQGDVDVTATELLYLSDLVNICVKQAKFRDELGFSSRNGAEETLNSLVHLRNSTMHLVRPLLERISEDLPQLNQRVRLAETILQRFSVRKEARDEPPPA